MGLCYATAARTIDPMTQPAARPAHTEATGTTTTQATPTLVTDDRKACDRPDSTDTHAARLEAEVLKLQGRCRAHEHALECLAGAVLALRRANRALTEENSILRLELERVQATRRREPEPDNPVGPAARPAGSLVARFKTPTVSCPVAVTADGRAAR